MSNKMVDLTFYSHIKEILENARKKTYAAINFAMVKHIGKLVRVLLKCKEEMRLLSMAKKY